MLLMLFAMRLADWTQAGDRLEKGNRLGSVSGISRIGFNQMIRNVDVENGAAKKRDEVSKCLHCSENHHEIATMSFMTVLLLSLLSSVLLTVLSL